MPIVYCGEEKVFIGHDNFKRLNPFVYNMYFKVEGIPATIKCFKYFMDMSKFRPKFLDEILLNFGVTLI